MLNTSNNHEVQHLPSLDDLEKLNHWSCRFCQLLACTLTNETFAPHAVSARMAALDVVAKVLEKKFDSLKGGVDYEEFYRKQF
jgi:hypothetical protein